METPRPLTAKQKVAGRAAFGAYSAAVGHMTIEGKPMEFQFDQMDDTRQRAWCAAAEASRVDPACGVMMPSIGAAVTDKRGFTGTVFTNSYGKNINGVHLDCVDSVGRPFEHWVQLSEITCVTEPGADDVIEYPNNA